MPKIKQPTFPIPDDGVPDGYILVPPPWYLRFFYKSRAALDVCVRVARDRTFLTDTAVALSSGRSLRGQSEQMGASASIIGTQEMCAPRTMRMAGFRMAPRVCPVD